MSESGHYLLVLRCCQKWIALEPESAMLQMQRHQRIPLPTPDHQRSLHNLRKAQQYSFHPSHQYQCRMLLIISLILVSGQRRKHGAASHIMPINDEWREEKSWFTRQSRNKQPWHYKCRHINASGNRNYQSLGQPDN